MAEGRKVETEGISIVEAPFYDLLKQELPMKTKKKFTRLKN
jgi:hypothetical protein